MFVFFFFVLGLVYFFVTLYFLFIAHTYRSSILIKIIKPGKALIFFSDKQNFISPNFIITPMRLVWLVSYNTQEFSYISVFFFRKFLIFLFSLLHFSTFLPLKVEEKQSLCHETAKWLTKRKPALDWTPVSGRFCIWANASAKSLQLQSSFRVLSFFLSLFLCTVSTQKSLTGKYYQKPRLPVTDKLSRRNRHRLA